VVIERAGESILSFVPRYNRRETNLPHAREESECSKDEWSPDELILVEKANDAERLRAC